MGKRREKFENPPARSPQERENQLINMAMDLAEQKMMDGTASSQIITHFLDLATVKAQLENEKLRSDLEVAQAKILQYQSGEELKSLYENALSAMKDYSGNYGEEYEDFDDGYD